MAASLAAGWLTPRLARACDPPECDYGALAPRDMTSVPANQPTLVIKAAAPGVGAPPTEPRPGENVQLERGGAPVPFSVQRVGSGPYWMITPEPLMTGSTYSLSYSFVCGAESTTLTSKFSVGPAAAPPASAGGLKTVRSGVEEPVDGTCEKPARRAVFDFQLAPSAELLPYLGVSRVIARVDGKPWGELGYGELAPDRLPTLRVKAPCNPGDAAGSTLALGKHMLEVSVEIAGGPTLTIPAQEVALSCDGAGGGGSKGGCSIGSIGLRPTAAGVLFLILAGGAVVRRRRR